MIRYLLWFFPTLLTAQEIKLAPPRIVSDQQFFKEPVAVEMVFSMENALIWYSLDEQATAQSSIYKNAVAIQKTTTIQAYATHPDFLPSDVVERKFIKVNHVPVNMKLRTTPNKTYPGKGAVSLFDLRKGSSDLHDGNWLGFLGDTVIVEAEFSKKISCNSLIFSALNDANAWILPMSEINVYGKDEKGTWRKIGTWKALNSDSVLRSPANNNYFQSLRLKKIKTRDIRIEIIPFGNLPKEHPGAGTPAWLFLDEIVFQ